MKKNIRNILGILMLLVWGVNLHASKGIVVSVNDKYAQNYFFASLQHLRENIKCTLPIEVWFVGDELSENSKNKILQYGPVSFCDLVEKGVANPNEYKGWQIKPMMLRLTSFDEVILMDADVFFYQNPENLFKHLGYVKNKCFFFRDRASYCYPNNPFYFGKDGNVAYNLDVYTKKRNFILSLIPKHGSCTPSDWRFYWNVTTLSANNKFSSEQMESGCIAIDIRSHSQSIDYTVQLNQNRKVTYQYVYGDKETYWIGCEMAGEPYYVNDELPYELFDGKGNADDNLYHFVNGKLFFQQKLPVPVTKRAFFKPYGKIYKKQHETKKRKIRAREANLINLGYQVVMKNK